MLIPGIYSENASVHPLEALDKEIEETGLVVVDEVKKLPVYGEPNLVAHHCESREVRFYARLLCLSPKYFGTIIKQETGVSAGEWIARYVVIRAKTLLRHRPDLTIQQIYQRLGFTDAATFSRYFKATAGMSAKAYRELWLR